MLQQVVKEFSKSVNS